MQAAAQKGSDEHGQMARDERDRVLQLLLSQERVISLLFDKTFPSKSALAAHRRSAAAPGGAPSALASSSQDELSGVHPLPALGRQRHLGQAALGRVDHAGLGHQRLAFA